MGYWQEKVVIVTGASTGFGRVLAEAFARAGATVVLAARTVEKLDEAALAIRNFGGQVLAQPTDVTDKASVERLMATTVERFGRIDAVVNNAGASMRASIEDTSDDDFIELIDLNLMSVVNCTRAALSHLLATGGHIVNIGSLAAKTASPYLGAYPASKFAVAAYSQQLRLELGPRGLHVLLVCPGPIARDDAGVRYDEQSKKLPASARQPGGGAKLRAIDPVWLAAKTLRACERRKPELIVPGKARLLFALAAFWPSLGDWIVRRKTKNS